MGALQEAWEALQEPESGGRVEQTSAWPLLTPAEDELASPRSKFLFLFLCNVHTLMILSSSKIGPSNDNKMYF